MSNDPSPEVVAAALALAEVVTKHVTIVHGGSSIDEDARVRNWEAVRMKVDTYRAAIAPKLRTQAERDAEFVPLAMRWFLNTECPHTVYERCQELAREQTAPDTVTQWSEATRAELEALADEVDGLLFLNNHVQSLERLRAKKRR